jgi:hypothetical protein
VPGTAFASAPCATQAFLRIDADAPLPRRTSAADTVLLRKFQQLDSSGDARVDQKELEAFLRAETPELTKRDAWLIMVRACGPTPLPVYQSPCTHSVALLVHASDGRADMPLRRLRLSNRSAHRTVRTRTMIST